MKRRHFRLFGVSRVVELQLKGGSCSSTVLVDDGSGSRRIRKHVSLEEQRFYGYSRWYSQWRRLVRARDFEPGFFPAVVGSGLASDGSAYFELEWVEGQTLLELLRSLNAERARAWATALRVRLDALHQLATPHQTTISLYFHEEVVNRLRDALKLNLKLARLARHEYLIVDGLRCRSLTANGRLEELERLVLEHAWPGFGVNVHGNPTLENTLVERGTERIMLIDPYEEGACTLAVLDDCQVLQSSWAHYELRNASTCEFDLEAGEVSCHIESPSEGLRAFDCEWHEILKTRYGAEEVPWVRLLCATQFIRMLPYKAVGDEEHCLYFFGLASRLVDECLLALH